jgi:UDP-glucose 4-epimerase
LTECKEAAGQVFNIGSTEEITIERLADKIIEMTRSASKKRYLSYEEAYGRPFDDMMRRVPCLDRVRAAVGYEAKTDLTQTLKSVIEEKRRTMDLKRPP